MGQAEKKHQIALSGELFMEQAVDLSQETIHSEHGTLALL
jgi:hypothetical protein